MSGMHPRVRPAEVVEVKGVGSGDPDLERRLAGVTAELARVRRERDDLETRLLAALEELAEFRQAASSATTVAPPALVVPAEDDVVPSVPDVAPKAPPVVARGSAELSRLVVSTDPPMAPASHADDAERRQHERLACEFDVEFLGDSHFITGIAEDLSERGIFVATYHLLPIGTPVTIGFEPMEGRRVEARGEVRWVRREREDAESRPGVGIAFTDLAPETLASIAAFLGALPSRYYEF